MPPFLCSRIIFVFFHAFGKHPFITLLLKRIWRDFEIDVAHNFKMGIEILSQSWTNNLIIVSVSMLMLESLITVSTVWLLERELWFVIGLYCALKKSLNRFALTTKSVTNSLFTIRGGINGNYYQIFWKLACSFLELFLDH